MFSKIVQSTFLFFADFLRQLSLLTFLLHIAILTILTSIGINAREGEREREAGKKRNAFAELFRFILMHFMRVRPYHI